MLKVAKNMRGKLALLYRVTGRSGHRLHIFLNSTYEQKVTHDIYVSDFTLDKDEVRLFFMA
jgi:hypothetical protein